MKGRKLTQNQRMQIWQKYGGRCAYCGEPIEYKDMQVDHIKPIFRGWSDSQKQDLPDEDCGYNTGRGKFVAGKCETEEYPQGGSREAYEIYFDTHPDSRKYFLFNDAIGNYEYNNEYEED